MIESAASHEDSGMDFDARSLNPLNDFESIADSAIWVDNKDRTVVAYALEGYDFRQDSQASDHSDAIAWLFDAVPLALSIGERRSLLGLSKPAPKPTPHEGERHCEEPKCDGTQIEDFHPYEPDPDFSEEAPQEFGEDRSRLTAVGTFFRLNNREPITAPAPFAELEAELTAAQSEVMDRFFADDPELKSAQDRQAELLKAVEPLRRGKYAAESDARAIARIAELGDPLDSLREAAMRTDLRGAIHVLGCWRTEEARRLSESCSHALTLRRPTPDNNAYRESVQGELLDFVAGYLRSEAA